MQDYQLAGWQRLEQVLCWTGLSTYDFAKRIGMENPQDLYRLRQEKGGISNALAERIHAAYPQVSRLWLLSGIGSMFCSDEPDREVILQFKKVATSDDLEVVLEVYNRSLMHYFLPKLIQRLTEACDPECSQSLRV